jgi:glycosyltransferase involved in cell wall biosynthesis
MGFVTEGRKPGFFRDIDALALVSDYECFGMAAAEAMVAGVPVILSEETGLTALARETGAGLIAARGADGIAAAIAALDADEDARFAMAERAAAAARAHLSFGAHGAALAACYAAMLDKATAR